MSIRDQTIFDHRLCPITVGFFTLQQTGEQLDLTRERVRQLEKEIVKQFRKGSLREFGWMIHRKSIDILKSSLLQLTLGEFLRHDFLTGIPPNDSPAPILFLDRIFDDTFRIDENYISLRETIDRGNISLAATCPSASSAKRWQRWSIRKKRQGGMR